MRDLVRKYLQYAGTLIARLIAWLMFRGPVVVTAGRLRFILDPRTGRLVPQMAGGAPDGDDGDASGDGDADGSGDGDGNAAGSGDAAADTDEDADGDGDADAEGEGDTSHWKAMARKHERRAKKERADREALAAQLKEREDADKTESERAIEAAREEGRTAALTEAQKERRSDRLEVAVTRLAARGIEIKDGDKTKTVKFADPEDALVFIERAIAKGDLDEDDVFDEDHKVKQDAITEELTDLLTRKPRLAASENGNGSGGAGRVAGDADAGKGKGAGGIEDMTVEEHIRRKQVGQR